MNPNRIAGVVLLVVGVALLLIGLNSSHSIADRLSNTFTGHFTDATSWYIVGGIAASLFGLLLTLTSWRKQGR